MYVNLSDYAIVKVEANCIEEDIYSKSGEQKKFCFHKKMVCYTKYDNLYYPNYLASSNNYYKHSSLNEQFAFEPYACSKKEINEIAQTLRKRKPLKKRKISDEHWQKLRQHEKYNHAYQFLDLEPFVKK